MAKDDPSNFLKTDKDWERAIIHRPGSRGPSKRRGTERGLVAYVPFSSPVNDKLQKLPTSPLPHVPSASGNSLLGHSILL